MTIFHVLKYPVQLSDMENIDGLTHIPQEVVLKWLNECNDMLPPRMKRTSVVAFGSRHISRQRPFILFNMATDLRYGRKVNHDPMFRIFYDRLIKILLELEDE